jgi:hypothetical protein
VSGGSPIRREGLLRRGWPFALALLVAFASLPFVTISDSALVAAAGALAAAIAACTVIVPWERLPPRAAALPPLAVVAVAFLLRHGTGGLSNPVDYEALLMLPVLWLALYGSRSEILTAVALGGVSFAARIDRAPSLNADGHEQALDSTLKCGAHDLLDAVGALSAGQALPGSALRRRSACG